QEAREAWRYRELLGNLVQRELDVRYKNSKLGVAWSLANPIVRALILWAVFYFVFNSKVDNYAAYVLAAFFPWTYFLTGVLDAGDSVSKQLGLVRKVYFPRELLPLATTIANLRHFLLSLTVVLLPLLAFLYIRDSLTHHRLTLPPLELLLLPLLVVMQTLLIGGIALFLSALNVFFEDIKFLTAVLLDLLFYAVPIMYFLEQVQFSEKVPTFIYTLFLLNPMTVILTCYRSFLLPMQPDVQVPGIERSLDINMGVPWPYFWLAFAVCVATFIGGYAFFNSRKWRFVEQV
ncbi:ABC transporter permease, partial [Armatimonas sp.]|uniref:ABC transporter permease n=1 Tax=Armatimonas sp. TaxID=1872638 RepID=UPI0037516A7A